MAGLTSVLFVHQGYELYGSDRTFIQSIVSVTERWPNARVSVLLPREGELADVLRGIVEDVRIEDLSILRRPGLGLKTALNFPKFILRCIKAVAMMRRYDVTYINTAVVLDYIVSSIFVGKRSLIHVHELPNGITSLCLSLLIFFSRGTVIYNSRATRDAFWPRNERSAAVIWNGVHNPRDARPTTVGPILHILTIGRFNAWKGQSLLLEALLLLSDEDRGRIRVRLVGSVFGEQYCFVDEIGSKIESGGLSPIVEVLPFADDPQSHYRWADLVVVPSLRPEPFGLVAIEGMAEARAVIAANHGGLVEIVDPGHTGFLFTPGSAEALAQSIQKYLRDPIQIARHGAAGRDRFLRHFEQQRYSQEITNLVGYCSSRL